MFLRRQMAAQSALKIRVKGKLQIQKHCPLKDALNGWPVSRVETITGAWCG
uniref:Uncharacterized protein n=1 Tax=Aquisalinus luteolus TaxID=1566827 RepID=A0A8J3EQ97_9PROT|nr:hypothetical protein GCM10011355_32030 [Aquisalinus luteolus]